MVTGRVRSPCRSVPSVARGPRSGPGSRAGKPWCWPTSRRRSRARRRPRPTAPSRIPSQPASEAGSPTAFRAPVRAADTGEHPMTLRSFVHTPRPRTLARSAVVALTVSAAAALGAPAAGRASHRPGRAAVRERDAQQRQRIDAPDPGADRQPGSGRHEVDAIPPGEDRRPRRTSSRATACACSAPGAPPPASRRPPCRCRSRLRRAARRTCRTRPGAAGSATAQRTAAGSSSGRRMRRAHPTVRADQAQAERSETATSASRSAR